MVSKSRQLARLSAATVLPGIAALLTVTVAATRPEPPSVREQQMLEAKEWAHANIRSLPTSLDAVSRFPYIVRKAVFNELSVAQRKALWQEQFDAFLTPPEARTAAQRRVTEALPRQLSEWQLQAIAAERDSLNSLFDPTINDSERGLRSARMCMRNSAVFSREEKAIIFVWLGGKDSSYAGPSEDSKAVSEASIFAPVTALLRMGAERSGLVPSRFVMCWCFQSGYTGCECGAGVCVQSYPFCSNNPLWLYCGCGISGPCNGAQCAYP